MNKIVSRDADFTALVDTVESLVGCSLGPWGANVAFFDGTYPFTFRDGRQILRSFQPVQSDALNNVVTRIRSRADVVRRAAGDSTTTMTLLMAAFYKAYLAGSKSSFRRQEGGRLRDFADAVCARLQEMAVPVTDDAVGLDLIVKVATLAGNNDPSIGEKIGKLVHDIGVDGLVSVELSETVSEMKAERMTGFVQEGGAHHESFLQGASIQGAVTIENPYVIVTDKVVEWTAIRPALEKYNTQGLGVTGRPLVIFCSEFGGSAHAPLVGRTREGRTVPIYVVRATTNDDLADTYAVTGGKAAISQKGGALVNLASIEDFGQADRIVLDSRRCIVVPKEGYGNLELRKSELRAALENETSIEKQDALKGRLSNLEGRVGIIKIPLETSGATTWLREVVEDAYMAAFAAMRDGVVPGAGISLVRAALSVDTANTAYVDACRCVLRTLVGNGGYPVYYCDAIIDYLVGQRGENETLILSDQTLKALSAEDWKVEDVSVGNAFEWGILDAVASLKAAVKNAAYEAAEWIETEFIVLPHA